MEEVKEEEDDEKRTQNKKKRKYKQLLSLFTTNHIQFLRDTL